MGDVRDRLEADLYLKGGRSAFWLFPERWADDAHVMRFDDGTWQPLPPAPPPKGLAFCKNCFRFECADEACYAALMEHEGRVHAHKRRMRDLQDDLAADIALQEARRLRFNIYGGPRPKWLCLVLGRHRRAVTCKYGDGWLISAPCCDFHGKYNPDVISIPEKPPRLHRQPLLRGGLERCNNCQTFHSSWYCDGRP